MSYLDVPRVHLAGTFSASPSTVNNKPENYAPKNLRHPAKGWNPEGDAHWTIDSQVTGVVDESGKLHDASNSADPLIGAKLISVSGPSGVPGKLVDLDPEQQGRTRLFGIDVQLGLADGTTPVLTAHFRDTACLDNLWFGRAAKGGSLGGDSRAGGAFQSVLEQIEWFATAGSPLLRSLQAASTFELSMRMTVYGYNGGKTFGEGKFVGTIGPSRRGEPRHFIRDRFLATASPSSKMNFAAAKLDPERRTLTIDFGNSIPEVEVGAAPADLGELQVAVLPASGDEPAVLGKLLYECPKRLLRNTFCYGDRTLLTQRAGIAEFRLSKEQVRLAGSNPLAVLSAAGGGPRLGEGFVSLRESDDGEYVAFDRKSMTLNPGDVKSTDLYATSFGTPIAGKSYRVGLMSPPASDANKPSNGILLSVNSSSTSVVTDSNGRACVAFKGGNPTGAPGLRRDIGGQLYFIGGSWASAYDRLPWAGAPITVKVFTRGRTVKSPTWDGHVRKILEPYYYLYPVMKRFVKLNSYPKVVQAERRLVSALTLPTSDALHMPVTRDLSDYEREIILRWYTLGAPRRPSPKKRSKSKKKSAKTG